MGFFYFLEILMEQLAVLEKRIKLLEEHCAWQQRDMANLINIVEALKQPEVHTHYTMITENVCTACMDDPNNTNDLKDFI
jgi:hypothetical protein